MSFEPISLNTPPHSFKQTHEIESEQVELLYNDIHESILENEPEEVVTPINLKKDHGFVVTLNGRKCHDNVKVLRNVCDITNCKIYAEIGVHNGASMSYAASSENVEECIGVDLFEDTIGHYVHDNLTMSNTLRNINFHKNSNCKINLIKGNSNDSNTLQHMNNILTGRMIDVLFIDADHTYNGVKRDYENYIQFVKINGYIVFDDYSPRWPGVVKFVDSIRNDENILDIGGDVQNEYIVKKIK